MSRKNNHQATTTPAAAPAITRADVRAFLAEIAAQVATGKAPTLHTMLALNGMFRLPNAKEIFDEELKKEAHDLWMKVKSAGLQVLDPPLLFGEPSNASEFLTSDVDGEESGDDVVDPATHGVTHTSHTI